MGTGTAQSEIINNLVHGEIRLEGGDARIDHNLAGQLDGYCVDPASGDLALTRKATRGINLGTLLREVTEDIRRYPRTGAPDLGAWELDAQPRL